MKLLKKTLHLNYSEPKGDKQVVKVIHSMLTLILTILNLKK